MWILIFLLLNACTLRMTAQEIDLAPPIAPTTEEEWRQQILPPRNEFCDPYRGEEQSIDSLSHGQGYNLLGTACI